MFNQTGHGLQITFVIIFVMLLSSGASNWSSGVDSNPFTYRESSIENGTRVVVGFWNMLSPNAQYISSKYHVPLLMSDEVLLFAVFQSPPDPDNFIKLVAKEQSVRYVEKDQAMSCMCGGGAPPPFFMSADPSSFTMVSGCYDQTGSLSL